MMLKKKAPQTLKVSQDVFQDCNILTGIRYQKCNAFSLQLIQPNAETHVGVAQSKGIQDWILDSLSVELGFRIPLDRIPFGFQSSGSVELYTGFQRQELIPDSIRKLFQDSRFHKQHFPGFQIPQAIFSRIPDSTTKIFPDFGIRIPLHWAIEKTIPRLSGESKGLKDTLS